VNNGINPCQDTTQAFRAADVCLHNFSVQASQHKAAHGSPDHQPRAHAMFGQLPGDFNANKSGGSCHQYFFQKSILFLFF
jgi:hypothetical protein